MPEQHLHSAQIGTMIEQMRGVASAVNNPFLYQPSVNAFLCFAKKPVG